MDVYERREQPKAETADNGRAYIIILVPRGKAALEEVGSSFFLTSCALKLTSVPCSISAGDRAAQRPAFPHSRHRPAPPFRQSGKAFPRSDGNMPPSFMIDTEERAGYLPLAPCHDVSMIFMTILPKSQSVNKEAGNVTFSRSDLAQFLIDEASHRYPDRSCL